MIISDLNYLEVVTDAQNVLGSWGKKPPAFAEALASAKADAIGYKTQTITATTAAAVAGFFSSSTSTSYAISED